MDDLPFDLANDFKPNGVEDLHRKGTDPTTGKDYTFDYKEYESTKTFKFIQITWVKKKGI